MAKRIESKAQRDRLPMRREPYWARIARNCHVGYRRMTTEGGAWLARYKDDDGKRHFRSLDLPPHLPPNEYDAAVTVARAWFDAVHTGARTKPGTVNEAAQNYLESLRARKGDRAVREATWRIKFYLQEPFGKRRLDKLTTAEIEKWLHAFVPKGASGDKARKAKSNGNRNFTVLKAILNHALRNGLVASDIAWRRVRPFANVEAGRKAYLTPKQTKALIVASSGAFKILVESAALTGARYGELAALRVRDLDAPGLVLNIREGKTGERVLPLTDHMLAYFRRLAKDKLPDAHLLTRDDGKPWGHSDQDRLMRAAARKAKLPDNVVFYTLRHSFIANHISAGMDIYSIAEICGTSVRMIEKHYGKLLKDRVREMMQKASVLTVV
jgi:integrase